MAARPLTPYAFGDYMIRVVMIDNLPWWVATDVAKALHFRNAPDMVRPLDDDQKRIHVVYDGAGPATQNRVADPLPATQNRVADPLPDTQKRVSGQRREMLLVNQSGLMACILRSSRPVAKRLQRWVTDELLPQLYRTGSYTLKGAATVDRWKIIERRTRAMRDMHRAKSDADKELHWRAIQVCCDDLGETCPPIEAFGLPARDDMAQLRHIWAIILPALDNESLTNHSRNANAGEIALHLTELLPVLAGQGMVVPRTRLINLLRLSDVPRFIDIKNVNAPDGVVRWCCLFMRDGAAQKSAISAEHPLLPFDGVGT